MRIGIANSTPMAVVALRYALTMRPQHKVAWVARDGEDAVAMCAKDTPDLLLMDLPLPGLDGVQATNRIMENTPCPILIVTSSVDANTGAVFDAMGRGAIDAVDIPVIEKDIGASAAQFLHKIDTIAKLVGTRRFAPTRGASSDITLTGTWPPCKRERLVAIGASAGGPMALTRLLSGLPQDFPASIVIVQHVDARFAPGMADWLTRTAGLQVRVAREGDRPEPGTVLLAGTNDHLVFKGPDRLGYAAEPRDHPYRPSVDVFFESLGAMWIGEAIGVLLTGMGRDGAEGLKVMRNKGYYTIAQDASTSAVYGMPKAAASLGAAVDILPLDRIAPRLIDTLRFQPGLCGGKGQSA
ncbi:MAG TPA: chemotaxis response regulator protein-glutamate methylesterase [Steroidobacteraceae bacterium]|nr:chemotaxis response regulator protein-glutamate methylesterase [Steroidobacteraceae bacterium]